MDDTPREGETKNGTAYLGGAIGGVKAECGKGECDRDDEQETVNLKKVPAKYDTWSGCGTALSASSGAGGGKTECGLMTSEGDREEE